MTESSSGRFRAAIGGLLAFKLAINTIVRAIYPFLPAIARGLGISLTAAGALVSIRWAASMGTPFLVGTLGRRRPSTTLMVVGAAIFSLGAIVTAVTGVFAGAVVGFIFLGIAKPLFDIGAQTWISERVPFSRRGRSFGIVETSWAGGLLVGAPLFGFLIDRYGWASPFLVIGVITALGTVVLALTSRQDAATSAPPVGVRSRLDITAVAFLAGTSLMTFAIEIILVVLGEWLEVGFGLTLLALGGVGTILGVAELVAEGGVLAFTDRIGSKRSLQIGTAGMALGFVLMLGVGESLVLGIATLTFVLLLFEFGIVAAMPLATEQRPDDRPRFLSIYLVTSAFGRVVADWVGPVLFDSGGIAMVAVFGTAFSLASFLVITRWVRQPAAA